MFEQFDVSPMPAGATDPGFFNRIAGGLSDLFRREAAHETPKPAALDPRLAPWAA